MMRYLLQAYSTSDEFDSILEKLIGELEHFVQNVLGSQTLPNVTNIVELLVITRRNREDVYAMSLVTKVIYSSDLRSAQ